MSEEKQGKGGGKGASEAPQMGAVAARKAAKQKWTLERCKRVARRFHNEAEWKDGAPSSYKAAFAKGWLKECKSEYIKDNVVSLAKVNADLAKKIQKQSA